MVWGLSGPQKGLTRAALPTGRQGMLRAPRASARLAAEMFHLRPLSWEQVRDSDGVTNCRWVGGINPLPQVCHIEMKGLTGQTTTPLGCPAIPVSHLLWQ